MTSSPQEVSIDIAPQARFDIINITQKAAKKLNGEINGFKKATYCSFHTTAGYLEQSLCSRLNYNKERIESFIHAFQKLFPINAEYRHDQMNLRTELSDAQKLVEPKNADSHLTFIGSGLKNCVTYANSQEIPVYFIDLDGVSQFGHKRNRQTSVMYYNKEELVYQHKVAVPFSSHPIDSINLRNPKLGYIDKLNSLLEKFEIEHGKVEITLDATEKHAGLTVNEYETLLMTNDLVEVLRNPIKFMAPKGKYLLQHPNKIASRTRDYAKYDFVHIFNELMDSLNISESVLEKILSKFMAFPAERFLRMKRSVSLLVSSTNGGPAKVVQGTYQSPILIQWKQTPKKARNLYLKITRFK